MEKLNAITPGGLALIPGGWKGQLSTGWVMHIVERSADGKTFAFTTANASAGLEYHVATSDHDKTKYRTCLRIEQGKRPIKYVSMMEDAWTAFAEGADDMG